jgi:16S rRNA processing protein RimM
VAGLGAPAAKSAAEVPPDLVELGAVRGAYGVMGWVRMALLGSDGTVLLSAPDWWLKKTGIAWRVAPTARRRHGTALLATWAGCDSKEAADALKGAVVAVPRSAFPPVSAGEYYWADLPGCRVINRDGDDLGQVTGLRENAGGQWLEVNDGVSKAALLIPMVEQYVEAVDPAASVIRVDWHRDW